MLIVSHPHLFVTKSSSQITTLAKISEFHASFHENISLSLRCRGCKFHQKFKKKSGNYFHNNFMSGGKEKENKTLKKATRQP